MPGQSPYQGSSPYGNFDDDKKKKLFPSGYGQESQTTSPAYPQGGPDDGIPGPGYGQQEMTEDEKVAAIEAETHAYLDKDMQIADNIERRAIEFEQGLRATNRNVNHQGQILNKSLQHFAQSSKTPTPNIDFEYV